MNVHNFKWIDFHPNYASFIYVYESKEFINSNEITLFSVPHKWNKRQVLTTSLKTIET